jgi:tetratricopeptide (TPR) repeat protein
MRKNYSIIVYLSLALSVAGANQDEAEKLFKARKYKDALTIFKRLDNKPGKKNAGMYIGYCLMKLKRYPEALNQFEQVKAKRGVHPRHKSEALLAIAGIQEITGRRNDALQTYSKLLAVRGAHPKHIIKAQSKLKNAFPAERSKDRPCPARGYGIYQSGKLIGIYNSLTAIIFDSSTGRIYGVWGDKGNRIITPGSQHISLWKLFFKNSRKEEIELSDSSVQKVKISTKRDSKGATVILDLFAKKADCKANIKLEISLQKNSPELSWKMIKVQNKSQMRLWRIVYPQLSVKVDGKPSDNDLMQPWRRGRLVAGLENVSSKQQYPGSSARFQCFAFYNRTSLNGTYLAANDTTGHEKEFKQSWNSINNALICSFIQFPADRGIPGNDYAMTYSIITRPFKGDWYDAARIYRAWWVKQQWAAAGTLRNRSDIPEWLKKTPVFLRFYARHSKNKTIEKNVQSARDWSKLLKKQATAGTWYHYAKFIEPPASRNKYPVAEYYGYCAPPYPGLLQGLKEMNTMNIRSCVFLQSEIYNQFYSSKDAEYMFPALRVDENTKPRLYVNERWVACIHDKRWQKRYLEMVEHLLDMGFWGIYLDTFGKNKIDHECFNVKHGHSAGGGNIDVRAQLILGRKVRSLIKRTNPDYYMGGEACTEIFVPILDYKLNAMNTYPGQLPLERAIYGDYILSHGRTIRMNDELNSCRILASNFTEGIIPGRFFGSAPKTPKARQFLKKMIDFTNNSFDYLRSGEMMRPLSLSPKPSLISVVEGVKRRKMQLPVILSAVYRSSRDGSIAIVLVNIGDKTKELAINIDPARYGFKTVKIQQMSQAGHYSDMGTIGKSTEKKIKIAPFDINFYILSHLKSTKKP